MVPEEVNILEYEDILLGRHKNFGYSFKKSKTKNSGADSGSDGQEACTEEDGEENGFRRENKDYGLSYRERCVAAGNIWRYAITKILGWTPQQAVVYLTSDIVKTLQLDKTLPGIDKYPGRDYFQDYRFVLQYAFPGVIKYDLKDETIAEYEHAGKLGKWANDTSAHKIPKCFWLDADGIERSNILLRHVIALYLGGSMNRDELYEFFSNKRKAKAWLNSKKLNKVLEYIYPTPLAYFHDSLPYNEQDDVTYYNYVLKDLYNEQKKQVKKGSSVTK